MQTHRSAEYENLTKPDILDEFRTENILNAGNCRLDEALELFKS
jgi:hypothetical protein